jgi:hypothetical protein
MMSDWTEIERAYRTSGASARRLARRYSVPESTLRHRAKSERWQREQPELSRATVSAEATAAHLTPLEYLLAVINDETAPLDRRADAAVMALPYCHRKAAHA